MARNSVSDLHPNPVPSEVSAVRYAVVDLGTLETGTHSAAHRLNNAGQVVGVSATQGRDRRRAFSWQNGVLSDLGTLGGTGDSIAWDVNDSGRVVGVCFTPDTKGHAVLWEDGAITDLGTLDGCESFGRAVNAKQEVAGYLDDGRRSYAAFFKKGHVYQMEPLDDGEDGESRANDINEAGQIVGIATTEDGHDHAVLWRNRKITDLGSLGGTSASALGTNNKGDVVGTASTPRGQHHAFLWRSGKMTNLNDLIARGSGWVLVEAADINDPGEIVGQGTIGKEAHAFLLTPFRKPTAVRANSGPTETKTIL